MDNHIVVTNQTVEEFESTDVWDTERRIFALLDRIATSGMQQSACVRYQFFPESRVMIQRYELKKCRFGECTSSDPNIKVDWACMMNGSWIFTIERDAFAIPPLPPRYSSSSKVDSHTNHQSYWLCVVYKNARHIISTMQECNSSCCLDNRRQKLWNWVIGNMLACFYPNGMLIPIADIDPEKSMEYTLESLLPLTTE